MLDSFTFHSHSDEFSFYYEQYMDYLNFLEDGGEENENPPIKN